MTGPDRPVVLLVGDDAVAAERYERWLTDAYAVRRAEPSAAHEAVDESVDVVVLDREPGTGVGEAVLRAVGDADPDCRVALVTAVDPGLDVVELGVDEHVSRPPDSETLCGVVAELLELAAFEADRRRYRDLARERARLEDEQSPEVLAQSRAYADLEAAMASLESALEAEAESAHLEEDGPFLAAVRDVSEEREVDDA
jgi:DNA-binding NtrC family response regulator